MDEAGSAAVDMQIHLGGASSAPLVLASTLVHTDSYSMRTR